MSFSWTISPDEIVCPRGQVLIWRRGDLFFTGTSVVALPYHPSHLTQFLGVFCFPTAFLCVSFELRLTLVGQEWFLRGVS